MNDSGLKQRLVGAAVLIALAVLFLPAILDGKKAQYFEQGLIPPRPADNQLAELAASLKEASNTREQQTKQAHNSKTLSKSSAKSKITGKETAYIVQVASFADETNANRLVTRLKAQHLKAYLGREKVKRNGQLLSRVLIGPRLLESEARTVLIKLKNNKDNKDFKASIVEFDPVKH